MPDKDPAGEHLPVPAPFIERRIYVIRGQKVMLSPDLAGLYQVAVRALNQAVKRNRERFPADFMFQLTKEEDANLKSQFVTSSWGGVRRATPYAFTEHGILMLSSVLNSDRARDMSILIVRAFIQLRELLATHKNLARKIEQLEAAQRHFALRLHEQGAVLVGVVEDIKRLKAPPKTNAIGFFIRRPKKK